MKHLAFYPTSHEIPLLLSGGQTAIVRPVKGNPEYMIERGPEPHEQRFFSKSDGVFANVDCPFGQAGTVLWGKETWLQGVQMTDGYYDLDEHGDPIHCTWYKSESPDLDWWVNDDIVKPPWNPAIVMPKSASRLWFKVKEVRVMQLSDVTEEMAVAAGARADTDGLPWDTDARGDLDSWLMLKHTIHSWKENPWVWYCEIEKIDKPEIA